MSTRGLLNLAKVKLTPKRDWYIPGDGCEPTSEKPTYDPNNWESIFHGSAWQYDAEICPILFTSLF